MTAHRIRFEGPATLAVRVATLLADASGVDLISSDPPVKTADGVALDLVAEGEPAAIAGALDDIRVGLPKGASIALVDG